MRIILSILLLISTAVYGSCDQLVAFGFPQTHIPADHNPRVLCRIHYVVEHNELTKTPTYSAEYLDPENFATKVARVNAFKADPDLDVGRRAELVDYNSSGYDRGHMSPADDVHESSAAMLQTFYLSNMVPQAPKLNRGQWKMLETQVRTWAKKYGTLYVITGPIYDQPIKTIGPNKVAIPTRLYKIVIDKEKKQAIAYLMPNDVVPNYKSYATTIAEISRVTNINFTPELSATDPMLTSIGAIFK